MGLWHYTVGANLGEILEAQVIATATKGVGEGENAVVGGICLCVKCSDVILNYVSQKEGRH